MKSQTVTASKRHIRFQRDALSEHGIAMPVEIFVTESWGEHLR